MFCNNSSYTTSCCAAILACFELCRSRFGVSPLFFACFDASNRVSNERAEDFSTVPTAAVNYRSRNAKARAAGGTLTGKVCGASAAPMPRHRSASIDLRSTTATAVPKHGGRSTSFHQLCLCAKSSSTARLCRDPATILPTRRLLGHRATQIGTVCLWNACAQPPLPRCPRNLSKPLHCDAAIFSHPSAGCLIT